MKKKYNGRDIAVVIPTRNRPGKISRLLSSIVKQTEKVGQIIIVSSGYPIKDIIETYKKLLPIIYKHSEQGGQIYQRNQGIKLIPENIRIVATLDDDIYLYPDAVEKMIDAWNNYAENVAGIGFNIVNESAHSPSKLKLLMRFTCSKAGAVMKSGFNTSLCNVNSDIKTDYLNGGATTWRKEYLENNLHKPIQSRWAVGEDLIFSYPISKKNMLRICAEAKVRHEHVADQFVGKKMYRLRGRTLALWRLYFVSLNRELSLFSYFWTTTIGSFGLVLEGIMKRNRNKVSFSFGLIRGSLLGIYRWFLGEKKI